MFGEAEGSRLCSWNGRSGWRRSARRDLGEHAPFDRYSPGPPVDSIPQCPRSNQRAKDFETLGPTGPFIGADHKRATIYHSPQKPGFTSWVSAWTMPDGDLMVCFTQAT